VKDADRVQTLGSLSIPLSRVLETSHLSLDQWFQLENSGTASRIYINAVLRVNSSKALYFSCSEFHKLIHIHIFVLSVSVSPFSNATQVLWLDEDHISAEVSSNLEAGFSKQLAKQASPHPSFATEVILTQLPGQELHVEVFDKDMDMKDDFMGRSASVDTPPVETIVPSVLLDEEVHDVKKTAVDVKEHKVEDSPSPAVTQPPHTSPDLTFASEVVLRPQSGQQVQVELFDKDMDHDDFLGSHEPSCDVCISVIGGLAQATVTGLPFDPAPSAKVTEMPKVGPSLPPHTVPGQNFGKELCDRSTEPQWNESFYFVIHDPKRQMLVAKARQFSYLLLLLSKQAYIQLKLTSPLIALQLSSGWDQPMGSLVITVKELLAAPQQVLDQWFHLDGALPDSQILLRAELKILSSRMVEMIGSGTLPCTSPAPGNGQVKLSLSYASKERKLVVIVHACRCVLKLLRSFLKILFKSRQDVDTQASLVLEVMFEYDLPEDEARFRRLGVSVKNNSASFRSRDVIGQVSLKLRPYPGLFLLSP
ncbi:hypothetical protein GOODEAATRI_013481, partial [Goodea atripinnis]